MQYLSKLAVWTLGAGLLAYAQTAPIPSSYQDLFTQLQNQLASFDNAIGNQGTAATSQVAYGAELSSANSNRGLQVLGSQGLSVTMMELDRLQALGVKSVTVALGFPTLYQPFYQFNGDPNDYQALLNYYKQVASSVHSRGMKLVVESQLLFPGVYSQNSGLNLSGYYPTLSSDQLLAARVQTMVTIANEIQPDYLNLGSEPDSLATILKEPALSTTQYSDMITSLVTQLKAAGVTKVPLGAGIGTWQRNGSGFVQALCSTGIDYLDLHVYPINSTYLTNVITYSDMAHNCGKQVAISEAWMSKERDSELGTIDSVTNPMVFARDVFNFWSPLDQKFLTDLVKVAQWKQMLYFSPFWTKYFWIYMDFSQLQNQDLANMQISAQILGQSNQTSGVALLNYQLSPTGQAYQNAISGLGNTQATITSAASFTGGSNAPGSIVSIFGSGLAASTVVATGTALPTSLGSTSVTITDSAGTKQTLPLYFVSTGQINAQIPAGLALGTGTLTVTNGGNTVAQSKITLSAVSPGLFTVNATGVGVAAALVVTLHADGSQSYDVAYQCSTNGTCVSKPINLGSATDQVALELFGTGIRGNSSLSAVQVTLGGTKVPAFFAGAQSQYPGLDQINILIPRSLAGAGNVNLNLSVNGVFAGMVSIGVVSN